MDKKGGGSFTIQEGWVSVNMLRGLEKSSACMILRAVCSGKSGSLGTYLGLGVSDFNKL